MRFIRNFINFLLDMIFPPLCLNCRRYLEKNEKSDLLCSRCFSSIIVNRVVAEKSRFILAAATDYQNPAVRNLIHYFKYKEFLAAKVPLAKLMLRHLEKTGLIKQLFPDSLIMPVPLHKKKLRERGFNQSEELGKELSQFLNLPMETKILIRVRYTEPQINLKSKSDREKNVAGAFNVNPKEAVKIKNRLIILIDDVYTSGATIKESARTLRKYGVKKIIALVVAKAG
jgi:competence protein ComFC